MGEGRLPKGGDVIGVNHHNNPERTGAIRHQWGVKDAV